MHLGTHTLVDLTGCDPHRLDDRDGIRDCMLEAARRSGCTIVNDTFHRFSPHGVSGVVVIAESHLTIHTWPEFGFAAVDMFTCGTLSADAALGHICEHLGSRHTTVRSLSRRVRQLPSQGGERPAAEPEPAYAHTESVGPGRELRLRMDGDWLVDEAEPLEALPGLTQRIQIGDFVEFGRGLILDGWVQLAEQCDALYTSALIYPAALLAASRKRWLIVGGGDGPAAREALRFSETEAVRLVDISKRVTAWTQRLMPSFWDGCQADPRLCIEHRDGWAVLKEAVRDGETFDLIVFDLTDQEEAGITPFASSSSGHLYCAESFRMVAQCLRPGGVFVIQVAELSELRFERHRHYRQLLQERFQRVDSYRVHVEFFGYFESFLLAYQHEPGAPVEQLDVDGLLAALYRGDPSSFYTTRWHRSLFTLPPALADKLRCSVRS
jgi:S-adenosylmethionine decarboxylase proenzyme